MPPLWPVPRAYSKRTRTPLGCTKPAAITPDVHLVVGGLTQAGASKHASTATVSNAHEENRTFPR
eukprot:7167968-Prymnesium_polylepis.1